MSCFVHPEKDFNVLAKYFKEELGVGANFTQRLIDNLFHFEVMSCNHRYGENDDRKSVFLYQGDAYRELDSITSIDALKLLDGIKLQCSNISSDKLLEKVYSIFRKIVEGILHHSNLSYEYDKSEEYEQSVWM